MEALKLTVWQLLVEATVSTSVAALIAFVVSVLLVGLIARLNFFEWPTSPAGSDKTLGRIDRLFTPRLARRSY